MSDVTGQHFWIFSIPVWLLCWGPWVKNGAGKAWTSAERVLQWLSGSVLSCSERSWHCAGNGNRVNAAGGRWKGLLTLQELKRREYQQAVSKVTERNSFNSMMKAHTRCSAQYFLLQLSCYIFSCLSVNLQSNDRTRNGGKGDSGLITEEITKNLITNISWEMNQPLWSRYSSNDIFLSDNERVNHRNQTRQKHKNSAQLKKVHSSLSSGGRVWHMLSTFRTFSRLNWAATTKNTLRCPHIVRFT